MEKKLDIPFYKNGENGRQCMQIAMRIVLKYFTNQDYSLEELDKITQRKEEFWTWTSQGVTGLYDLGLKIKYFSKEDLKPFLEGEPFIRKHFGKDADKILKFTDLPVLINSIDKLINKNIFEKRILSLSEIEKHILKGHVPIVLIDNNKVSGKRDLYQGHYVVLTGFNDNDIYYHDSGPTDALPNKKVPRERFIEAFNANGTDNDVIIVYGKR